MHDFFLNFCSAWPDRWKPWRNYADMCGKQGKSILSVYIFLLSRSQKYHYDLVSNLSPLNGVPLIVSPPAPPLKIKLLSTTLTIHLAPKYLL